MYKSCDLIEHGLDFFTSGINLCCRVNPDRYRKIIDFNGGLINLDEFFKIKRQLRERMKRGDILPECRNCVYLEEKEWDNDDYISFINFNNWIRCNERCIYCSLDSSYPAEMKQYNVYPALKNLAENGFLKPGGHITIAGGEPCFAPEFNNLINLFLDYKLSPVRVLTNASKFSEALLRGIQAGSIYIVVSVDSGTHETFVKVKRRDFYNEVWENIKKYASVQPYSDRVKTKFILIPGVNDTKEEITAWLDKSIEAGVKHIAFDIEMMYYNKIKDNIPKHIIEMTAYTIQSVKNKGLDIELIDRGRIIADKI